MDILPILETKINVGRGFSWTSEEHMRFLEGLKKHGKDYQLVSEHVATRDIYAVRTHAMQLKYKLQKNPDHPDADILLTL